MTIKTLLAAVALAPLAVSAMPAHAQVAGIAVADAEAAIQNSRAWTAARGQIQTTYKAQLDQAQTRSNAIRAEIQPLVTAYQTAARAPGANEASLRPQLQAIQTREQAGQAELARLTQPAQRAQAYAVEQISAKLRDAIAAASRAKNVSLLLRPEGALFATPTADITSAITAELDRTVPTVSITPPANWQPGQQDQAGGAAAPAATTAPAAARPQGR